MAQESVKEPQVRMSFGEHLNELRRRLIFCVVGVLVGVGVAFYHIDPVIDFLVHPYRIALMYAGYPSELVITQPAEKVIIYFSLAMKVGLVLVSPWIIWQVWLFVAAGLYPKERRLVYKYIGPSILLFLTGVTVFFYVVLPIILHVLVGFGDEVKRSRLEAWPLEKVFYKQMAVPGVDVRGLPDGDEVNFTVPAVKSDPTTAPAREMRVWFNAEEGRLKGRVGKQVYGVQMTREGALFSPMPTLTDYLSFMSLMALIFGVAFETPMVMTVVAQLGFVSAGGFQKWWKFAWLGSSVVAALVAPSTDVTTFLILTVMLILLYELGVLMAWVTTRGKRVEAEVSEE